MKAKKTLSAIISYLLIFSLMFSALSVTAVGAGTAGGNYEYCIDKMYINTQTNEVHIVGWVFYRQNTSATIRVWNEHNGANCYTNISRDDVNYVYGIAGKHGFDLVFPQTTGVGFNLKLTFVYEPTNFAENAFDKKYGTDNLGYHTVTYSANGGSNAPSSQNKINGVGITLTANQPTRPGFRFKGWATSKSGEVKYSSKELYRKDADITLYAVWTAVQDDDIEVEYQTGDIIELGSYPQTRVTTSSTISALNSCAGAWVSYGYYSGTGSTGSMKQADYMKYKDVTYNGNRYRAVKISSYRPYYPYYASSDGNSYQSINGYSLNTVYWFKYEPITWKVLDPEKGLIVCENVIDSQPFSDTIYGSSPWYKDSDNTIYTNNYAESTIRQWLNDDFYNTAFNSLEKRYICTTQLDNSAYSATYSQYDSATTNDNVFLLTYADMQNTSYGFENGTGESTLRQVAGSDYAKSQGLHSDPDNGYCWWLLRTAGEDSARTFRVGRVGGISAEKTVADTTLGIRPALTINLSTYKPALKTGEVIEFGSYPQTKVSDTALIAALNACEGEWISYGYYSGTGSIGSMTQKDYMKYKDVSYKGNRYRAVTFTAYRPYYTYYGSSASNSYQDNNEYTINTIYWFKYEPIKWKVLDPTTGLILCQNLVDSQAFSDTVFGSDPYYKDSDKTIYLNNYEKSTIRQWLNDTFYNTAFNILEQQSICVTEVDNTGYYLSTFSSATTNDKVFLLSYADVQNSAYGFAANTDPSSTRMVVGSDYAKCQGLYVNAYEANYGYSDWILRTAGTDSEYACGMNSFGTPFTIIEVKGGISDGIRPAITIDLLAKDCVHSFNETVIQPTCVAQGYTTHICTKCNMIYSDNYTDALNHNIVNDAAVPATCLATGLTAGSHCTRCNDETVAQTVIPALSHDYTGAAKSNNNGTHSYLCKNGCNGYGGTTICAYNNVVTKPTCIAKGYTTHTCTVCGYSFTDSATDTIGHTKGNWIVDTPATATQKGSMHRECIVCHITLQTAEIPAGTYQVGNTVQYGSYPQSQVKDADIISALNTQAGDVSGWTSYDYYIESTTSSFMKYTDVEYNNAKYRGVYYTEYRPSWANNSSSAENSNQNDNGFTKSTVYWFKYEPLMLKVLSYDNATNSLEVITENIIDSRDYYHIAGNSTHTLNGITGYDNNYEISNIRQWLNDTFFNTAFTESQREYIKQVTNQNPACHADYSQYDANDTLDYVYLLSLTEAQNTAYGFINGVGNTATRQAKPSDYAKCQGVFVDTNSGHSTWMIRTAAYEANLGYIVNSDGEIVSGYMSATDRGVRPVFTINTAVVTCVHTFEEKITPPTCTAQGYTTHTCTKCNYNYIDSYKAVTQHNFSVCVSENTPATCVANAKGNYKCANCTATTVKDIADTMLSHDYTGAVKSNNNGTHSYLCKNGCNGYGGTTSCTYNNVVTKPTCTAKGYTTYACSVCSYSYTDNETGMSSHNYTVYLSENTPATCIANAKGNYKCANCTATTVKDIADTMLSHDYTGIVKSNNNGTHSYLCENGCNGYGGTTGCTYNNVVTKPTCTAKGYTTYTCSVCSYSYTDNETDMSAHNYTVYLSENTAASCIANRKDNYKCASCTATTVKEIANTALGHDMVNGVAVSASCTTPGLTAGSYCTRCDNATTAQQVIPALGHDYVNHTAQAPSCTVGGYDAYKTCSRCDFVSVHNTYPALGHELIDHEAKAATCLESGCEAYKTCSRCDYSTYKAIGVADHKPSDWIIDTYPTCTQIGTRHKECTVCHKVIERGEMETSGHHDDNRDGKCDECGGVLTGKCNHICHKSGWCNELMWKIINFFNKLFQVNQYCSCGARHW